MDKNRFVIPFDSELERSGKLRMTLQNLAKTAATLFITVVLSEILRSYSIGGQVLIMVYILSVSIVSRITTGYTYGVLASVLSAFAFDFLITEPRMGFSFAIGFPITLCAMLVVVFCTSALTVQLRSHARLAEEREQRTLLLYELNQKLLAAQSLATIIKVTNEYLVGHAGRSVIFYTQDPLLPDSGVFMQSPSESENEALFTSEAERYTAHEIYMEPSIADRCAKSGRNVYYAPIVSKDTVLGLIGVSCAKSPLSQPGVLFIKLLVGKVALALELRVLADEQSRIRMETEREKTRVALLRAISHDLRTPLTSILGASSTILEQKIQLDKETGVQLITDIKENAEWLIRIVENLLSVTRITTDAMKLEKSMEAAEEVMSQSLGIVRKRFPDCHIHTRIPEEVLFVPMEATLISQVIINLLENSIKNSASGSLILFDVKKSGEYAEFSVSDSGRGIPDDLLDNLFEAHCAENEHTVDSVSGMGIGLSICKTIIQAHGGTIMGKNKKDGGAYFGFTLPLKEGRGIEWEG